MTKDSFEEDQVYVEKGQSKGKSEHVQKNQFEQKYHNELNRQFS